MGRKLDVVWNTALVAVALFGVSMLAKIMWENHVNKDLVKERDRAVAQCQKDHPLYVCDIIVVAVPHLRREE